MFARSLGREYSALACQKSGAMGWGDFLLHVSPFDDGPAALLG
jgi:hypothetical protein